MFDMPGIPAIDKKMLATVLVQSAGKRVSVAQLASKLAMIPGVRHMVDNATVDNLWAELREDPGAWKLIEPYQIQLRKYLEDLLRELRARTAPRPVA